MKDPALSGGHFLNHEFDFEFMVKNRSEVIKLADIRVGAAFQQCLQINGVQLVNWANLSICS